MLRTNACYDELMTNDQNLTGEEVKAIEDQHAYKEDLERRNLERSAFSETALLLRCVAQLGTLDKLAGSDVTSHYGRRKDYIIMG